MWQLTDRRRAKRHHVEWDAELHCIFSQSRESAPAKIVDISLTGAKLYLERLQIGSYHLLIGDPPEDIRLILSLPEGHVEASVEFRWYNLNENQRKFVAGVQFIEMSREEEIILKQALRRL